MDDELAVSYTLGETIPSDKGTPGQDNQDETEAVSEEHKSSEEVENKSKSEVGSYTDDDFHEDGESEDDDLNYGGFALKT